MRSIGLAVLLCVLAAAPIRAPAAPATTGPWLDPANADRYVFIGTDVWDAAAGKLIAAGAAPILYPESRPVAHTTDRFWLPPTERGLPGIPAEGVVYSTTDDYQRLHPTLNGEAWSSTADFPGFWIANDLRRAVWIEKGDFWRGMVDWNKQKVVDRKQVTNAGVFTGKSPLLWSGELLFVNGGFDPQKPIVRIDLKSGATEEIETYNVFDAGGSWYANGAGSACCLVRPTAETLYTYDVRTGKAGTISNQLFNNPKVSTLANLTDTSQAPIWVDDETVVFVNAQAAVTKVNLRTQQMQILLSYAPPERFRINPVLPGGRYLDVRGANPPPDSMMQDIFKERFLIDLATGQKIPTTLPADADNGMWLDDSKFVFVRKTGGLSGVGTWLYDRASNSSKRIAPAQLETTRMTLLRGATQIWAVNTAGGTTLWRAKVDGSGAEELGASQMFAPLQFPTSAPLDLGLTAAPPAPPKEVAPPVAVAPPPATGGGTVPGTLPPAPAPAQPTAAAPAPIAPTPYAVCWGGQTGGAHAAYFSAPFAVRALNAAGWSAAYKQFLTDKYGFAGTVRCSAASSLTESQQRTEQTKGTMRARWTIVETGWKFE